MYQTQFFDTGDSTINDDFYQQEAQFNKKTNCYISKQHNQSMYNIQRAKEREGQL